MKKLVYGFSLLILMSCSGKDEQFCKCLEAGETLNAYSVELWETSVDAEKAKELKRLKAEKKKACADYQTMSGDEMLDRKKECSSNN